jgi:hypothetical protein
MLNPLVSGVRKVKNVKLTDSEHAVNVSSFAIRELQSNRSQIYEPAREEGVSDVTRGAGLY